MPGNCAINAKRRPTHWERFCRNRSFRLDVIVIGNRKTERLTCSSPLQTILWCIPDQPIPKSFVINKAARLQGKYEIIKLSNKRCTTIKEPCLFVYIQVSCLHYFINYLPTPNLAHFSFDVQVPDWQLSCLQCTMRSNKSSTCG